jgi:membrane associated rhomboid family serine protease
MEASPHSRLALAMMRRDRRPSILARGRQESPLMPTSTPRPGERASGRWPVATVSVLAVTAVLTVLQYPFPQVRTALWRDPELIAAGQRWRLVTALFVQYDVVWQIVVVLACIAAVGVLAERIFGHGWWLVIYLGCGVIGQLFGYLWEPPDAGASVAGAGLLGAVSAWLLSPAGPRQLQVRIWGVLWPLVAIALTLKQDQHGPAAGRLRRGRPAAVAGPAPPALRHRGGVDMARLEVVGDRLSIQIEGMDRLWSLKSRLEIPLAHVAGVEADPAAARGWKGWRAPGAHMPGVIVAVIRRALAPTGSR